MALKQDIRHFYETFQSKNPRRSQLVVGEAVEMFIDTENWDGLAVIFVQLPSGTFHAFAINKLTGASCASLRLCNQELSCL